VSVVRQLRLQARMTPEDLSAKSNVSVRAIRNLESGDTSQPRDNTILQLAEALNVAPDELDAKLRAERATRVSGDDKAVA
jgi:transcriptional regulator with XRE-family HTH domain